MSDRFHGGLRSNPGAGMNQVPYYFKDHRIVWSEGIRGRGHKLQSDKLRVAKRTRTHRRISNAQQAVRYIGDERRGSVQVVVVFVIRTLAYPGLC